MEIKREEFRRIADEIMDENGMMIARAIYKDVPLSKMPDIIFAQMLSWRLFLQKIEAKIFGEEEGDADGGNDNPKQS